MTLLVAVPFDTRARREAREGRRTTAPLIDPQHVIETSGSVIARSGGSMSLRAGEVPRLLGDHGAGRSTPIQTLSGVHLPSEGRIRVEGRPARVGSPPDVLDRDIATVFQDLATIPLLSIGRTSFRSRELATGAGPLRRFDAARANAIARGIGRDRHRSARSDPGDRRALGRRAAVRADAARASGRESPLEAGAAAERAIAATLRAELGEERWHAAPLRHPPFRARSRPCRRAVHGTSRGTA